MVLCVPTGKSTESDTPAYNHWLELIDERNEPVAVAEIMGSRVGTVLPIIYCTNKKDITDDANWAPCILRKVRKEQFEILDTNEVDTIGDWIGMVMMVLQMIGGCTISIRCKRSSTCFASWSKLCTTTK